MSVQQEQPLLDTADEGTLRGTRDAAMLALLLGYGEAFQTGIPKELFEARLTPEPKRNRYIVTADGTRFLMIVLAEQQERASARRVVLNWPALLKR